VIASKAKLLASRTAELQRCKQELLQHRGVTYGSDAAAGDKSKRQRLHSSNAESPLGRDDLLDAVFSFVGGGDHLYMGGVSKRWRGRYIQYCVQNSTAAVDSKLMTRQRSILMTESRLQLALSSGLTVTGWSFDTQQNALQICHYSLEPEKVVALLRVHGVPWSTMLCIAAAISNKLRLLQWLRTHSCPWEGDAVLHYASLRGSVAMLERLSTVIAPWSSKTKRGMLHGAALFFNIPVAQWLRAHGAVWPDSFSFDTQDINRAVRVNWSVTAVQWASGCGSGWLNWKCEDYAADKHEVVKFKQQAAELLEWAHANGCPCTCGHVQQQQQQQQQ
jgi:hypothetical protein